MTTPEQKTPSAEHEPYSPIVSERTTLELKPPLPPPRLLPLRLLLQLPSPTEEGRPQARRKAAHIIRQDVNKSHWCIVPRRCYVFEQALVFDGWDFLQDACVFFSG